MLRLARHGAAAMAVLAVAAFGPTAPWAQDVTGATFGSGAERICNPLIDSKSDPVLRSSGESVVITNHTYDCPEPVVAAVEPAAPPLEPIPETVVYFDFDKDVLNAEARAALEDVIFDVKDRQLSGVTVGGYTDTAGPAEYNKQLSQRRATAVASELIKAGIPARIVTTEAFGQTQLAVETPDNTPNRANRRAVVNFEL